MVGGLYVVTVASFVVDAGASVLVCVVFISVVVTVIGLRVDFFVLGGVVAVGFVTGAVDFVLVDIFFAYVVERSSSVVGAGVFSTV